MLALHQNAQRLLAPLAVVNPYSEHLTFVDDRTRTRRDHEKYLTLIDAIALLHQHQRKVQTVQHGGKTLRYVEATPFDIETANRLASEVLGRTLDELPPKTRELLRKITLGWTSGARPWPSSSGVPVQPPRHPGSDAVERHAAEGPPRATGRDGVPARASRRSGAELRLRAALPGRG